MPASPVGAVLTAQCGAHGTPPPIENGRRICGVAVLSSPRGLRAGRRGPGLASPRDAPASAGSVAESVRAGADSRWGALAARYCSVEAVLSIFNGGSIIWRHMGSASWRLFVERRWHSGIRHRCVYAVHHKALILAVYIRPQQAQTALRQGEMSSWSMPTVTIKCYSGQVAEVSCLTRHET